MRFLCANGLVVTARLRTLERTLIASTNRTVLCPYITTRWPVVGSLTGQLENQQETVLIN